MSRCQAPSDQSWPVSHKAQEEEGVQDEVEGKSVWGEGGKTSSSHQVGLDGDLGGLLQELDGQPQVLQQDASTRVEIVADQAVAGAEARVEQGVALPARRVSDVVDQLGGLHGAFQARAGKNLG